MGLGYTFVVRVQGKKLKRKTSFGWAACSSRCRRLSVHDRSPRLAHLRHKDHDKAFYRLCSHIDLNYHRHELDLRLWLWAERTSVDQLA